MRVFSTIVLILICSLIFIFNSDDNYKIKKNIYNNYLYVKYSIFDIYLFFKEPDKKIKKTIIDKNNINKFIAHAGGKIDKYIYTNTLEALDANYKKGFRLFELDIIKTKDNFFVASHDWKSWKEQTNYKKSIPPTLKEFKKYKIYNKYTPMDMKDINQWFNKYNDAILVTDKINTPLKFSKKFIDNKRLIMELFDWYAVNKAIESNVTAMPTWSIVKKLKRNIVKKLLNLNIQYIALSRKTIYKNKSLLKELRNNNIKTYAFHINFENGKDEKYVFCNELDYFYGFYADKWDFEKINCKNTR